MNPVVNYLTDVLGIQSFLRAGSKTASRPVRMLWVVSEPVGSHQELLNRMTAAMGIRAGESEVLVTEKSWSKEQLEEEIAHRSARVSVQLGVDTHSLSQLATDPNAKRETWAFLKEAMRQL